MLRAEAISYLVGKKILLHQTSMDLESGKLHVIMGANGAGKSTLLKLLAGEKMPSTGSVSLDQTDISTLTKIELAKKRAVLSQHYQLAFPISVLDLVLYGRYPYYANSPSPGDKAICKKAIDLMQIEHLTHRSYETLSGGEAQKAQMSRVLAQIWGAEERDQKLLFLDEPVSHLDVKYQYELLRIAKRLCGEHNTVVAILHDINLALSFADRIIMMKHGKVVYDFNDLSYLSPSILRDVFDIQANIIYPEKNKPVVIF